MDAEEVIKKRGRKLIIGNRDSAGRSCGRGKGEHPTGCRLAVTMRDL